MATTTRERARHATTRRPKLANGSKSPKGRQPAGSPRLRIGRPPGEVWGALLVLAGIIDGLGTYANLTGEAGRALRAGASWVIGSGRVLLPLALVGVGVALIAAREDDDAHPGRCLAGAAVAAAAVAGLLHLTHGAPALGGRSARIEHAGGYVGAALAAPLHAVLDTWGTTVILVALGLVGVLLATNTRPRAARSRSSRPSGPWDGLSRSRDRSSPTGSRPSSITKADLPARWSWTAPPSAGSTTSRPRRSRRSRRRSSRSRRWWTRRRPRGPSRAASHRGSPRCPGRPSSSRSSSARRASGGCPPSACSSAPRWPSSTGARSRRAVVPSSAPSTTTASTPG